MHMAVHIEANANAVMKTKSSRVQVRRELVRFLALVFRGGNTRQMTSDLRL
jgi:hypothetical protein